MLRNKKLLLIIGGALIVLVAVFSIYAILVTPARQPYRDAQAQYKNVYNANIAVMERGASINASSATDEQFIKSTEAINAALDSLKIENDALAKYDVLSSGEGESLYRTFSNKLTAYIAYNKDMVVSMQKVRPVIYECSNAMTNVSESEIGIKAMKDCANNLGDLQSVPDADYRQMVADSQEIYLDFAANLEKRAALADPEGADANQYAVYSSQQNDILKNLNTVSSTFSSNLKKSRQKVDITEAAIALDKFLGGKSRVFQV